MLGMDLFSCSLISTFLIGIATVFLLYWYSTRNHDYWKKKNVPYVKPLPLIGSIRDTFSEPLHEVEIKRYFKYGKIYGHYEGNKAHLSVGDPKLLRDIFVKDFHVFGNRREFNTGVPVIDNMLSIIRGENWKRVRTIITPTFTTGKIKRMQGIFKDCSKTLLQNFMTAAKKGQTIDAKRLYGAFTMDIIASSAFSTKIDSHNDPDNEFAKIASTAFNQKLNWKFLTFLVAPSLTRFFKINVFGNDTMAFFKNVTFQIMEERKRTGQVRNDFLQILMDTAKEDSQDQSSTTAGKETEDVTSNYGEENVQHQIFKNVTSKHLSLDELVAQCVIFFLAGYDTTASTLSFTTYLLALNQDIQDKLRKEVDETLREYNGELTYDGIQEMKYLDNVISETLRMYPPVSRLEREAEMDYELGDTGITILKGMIVTIPPCAMHKDPNLFTDPEKFDPDRFKPEERAKRDPYSYLPFGAGPRNCVAMRFALMEVKFCIAHVISNFVVKRCPETKVPLEFNLGQQGVIQPKEITLQLEIRTDSPFIK